MLEIVAGPPFAGKTEYIDGEIARREDEGESGIIRIDFTAIFMALFPAPRMRFGPREQRAFPWSATSARR